MSATYMSASAGVKEGVNEPLVRQTLAFIEMHQERLNMGHFISFGELGMGACGAIGCFAGWAYQLSRSGDLNLDRLDERMLRHPNGLDTFPPSVLHEVKRVLGMDDWTFHYIYDFTAVDVRDSDGFWAMRRPNFNELCDRVETATGIRFKPPLLLGDGADD